jgi:Mn2+/Fe2+ NRAMP family transporter
MDTAELYKYLDFLWIPAGLLVARKHQRLFAALFIATCLLTLRLQVELVEGTGFSTGFLPWLHSPARTRGEVTYSVIIALYLILVRFSPHTKSIIFFAASLSIYFMAFCLSMVIMAL